MKLSKEEFKKKVNEMEIDDEKKIELLEDIEDSFEVETDNSELEEIKAKYEELKELIQLRVEFQRNGFFYPEVAMYMAEPQQVLNAFYVRHDRLRTRIDDQEHNLSGYVAYLNHFA